MARLLGSRRFKVTGACLLAGNLVLFGLLLVVTDRRATGSGWPILLAGAPMLVPTAACFARALAGGPRRAAAVWLGAGMLAWTAGNLIFIHWTRFQADPPVPSPADVAYMAFYACAGCALINLFRRGDEPASRGLWLDGALGAAGGATAVAVLLSPVLTGSAGHTAEQIVGAAYMVADLLLVAAICGILALRGARGGSVWLWLAGGLAVFCATDIAYALQVKAGSYAVGTVLNVLWMLGITILAFAVWRPERPPAVASARSPAVLAVPLLATLTVIVVLTVASFERLPPPVGAFATFTLLLAAVRTLVSFRQVQRLSDARRQAVTDDLTGLGNRRSLFEHGGERLRAGGPAARLALMLIDLDNFKEVNDTLGHHVGDELLRETARRLGAGIGSPDLLVRLGGDEFAILATLEPGDDGQRFAERVLDRVIRPVLIEGVRLRVDASAGLAERDCPEATIADLLRRADVAMYAAKGRHARIQLYAPQLDEANRTRMETIQDLEAALLERQFVLHFQPKIDVADGRIVGAEALVRWRHPTRGLLYPDAFLPVVERSGSMGALTCVVLQAAVEQLATWRREGLEIAVAVNLSASDLLDEDLARRIGALLAEHAVPPGALELEITESVLMTDPPRARAVLERLRRLGLRVAVDDYGTGYSSLAYLRDLPVDELKIDRSLISGVSVDSRSAAIVRSTVELAHALALEVVAEGVELEAELRVLAGFGCDYAQGYHFCRPLPADEFAAWARRREHDPEEDLPSSWDGFSVRRVPAA